MKTLLAASLFWIATVCPAFAQISVTQSWVRATVPQQKSTGAFMRITAAADARLVDVRSPLAASAEVHEMKMEGEVMKMRRVAGLALPAGQPVDFAPGGYHLMLMDLKESLEAGEQVPLTLVVESRDGKRESIEIMVPVQPMHHRAGHMH